MLIDARSVEDGATLSCDLCVVGAGPAGISLVDRLRDAGLSICLLESGGFEPELRVQRLYRGKTIGHPYYPLHGCRFRMFGGSSNRWGGWCRPLDRLDFEQRDWVPESGWPIHNADLAVYEQHAAKILELPLTRFNEVGADAKSGLPLEGSDFEHAIFQYSPPTNFARAYGRRILDAPAVRTMFHANVVGLQLAPGSDRVGVVAVRTLTGRSFNVRAEIVVLAAGGIENARLLLTSNGDRTTGIGNENDLVGRFFMEHPHVAAGHLAPARGTNGWDFYRRTTGDTQGIITPTADAQRRHRLLTTSITIELARVETGTPFLNVPPEIAFPVARTYLHLGRGGYTRLADRARSGAERGWRRVRRVSVDRDQRAARRRVGLGADFPLLPLYIRAEQMPDRANRVLLGNHRDALGVPLVELHWRLSEADTRSITGWLRVLDATLRERRLGQVIMPPEDWTDRIVGGPHHIGTTRMSDDPKRGVVDPNCRVHSVENLYVAGSSVFPTGGHANPTFTLVALALRLADHLRERVGRRSPESTVGTSP